MTKKDRPAGDAHADRQGPGRYRLWIEFTILFLAVPAVQVAFVDSALPFVLFGILFAATIALLAVTPGFRWRELTDCRGLASYVPLILALVAVCVAVVLGLVLTFFPSQLFGFPRHAPEDFALVMALYPFLSALEQEVTYRLLFFRRYRRLFPSDGLAIATSAVVFSCAHLFFMNWIAVSLTLVGGLVFAWAYVRTSSFPLIWILHSLAGQIVFTLGLGTFFYRPIVPG